MFLPVIEASCQYAQPSRYDDELEIRTHGADAVAGAGRVRLRVVRLADGARAATGRTVHAAVNREGGRAACPRRFRAALSPAVSGRAGRNLA